MSRSSNDGVAPSTPPAALRCLVLPSHLWYRRLALASIAAVIVALGGCSGGSDGTDSTPGSSPPPGGSPPPDNPPPGNPPPDGGNDATIVGTLDGFGSLYVSGLHFDVGDAEFRINDADHVDGSALAIGMKVRVQGTINDDGLSGVASKVFYDADVEGPIDAGSLTSVDARARTFAILGVAVGVDSVRTAFGHGTSFETLAEGQALEVSGYFDGERIRASRVAGRTGPVDEVHVKGTVSSYDGTVMSLTLQNGAGIGPFEVGPAIIVPVDPVGLLVELTLRAQGGGLAVAAVEAEDDQPLIGGEVVSIRGILSDGGNGGLLVNGVPFVPANSTVFEPAGLDGRLAPGMDVRVTGTISAGVLTADEIVTREGDVELNADVAEVTTVDAKHGTVALDLGVGQTLSVRTRGDTQYVDRSSLDANADGSFDLAELVAGADVLRIEAYQNAAGELVAIKTQRQDTGQDTRVMAPLEDAVPDVSVTLLGLTYMVDGATIYEVNDTPASASAFFDSLGASDPVRVNDLEPDGTAEKLARFGVAAGPEPGPDPEPPPPESLGGINVSFKLDPRLTQGSYLGDRWVSPPLYTRVQEAGKPLAVDARAHGVDADGRPVEVSPEWIAGDATLLDVSPPQGTPVVITVHRVGQTRLDVVAGEVSRSLDVAVKAHVGGTMLVEISQ